MERTLLSRHYRYFISVAEHKSLTIAAEKLFVTVSAISKSISTLEKNLDYTLFIRDNSGFRLTEKGQAIYTALKKIQESAEFISLEKTINSSNQRINIVTDSLMCRLLDDFLYNMKKFNYKDIRLFYDNETDALLKVTSGEADIAILYIPSSPIPPQLIYHDLPITPLALYTLENTFGVDGNKKRIIVSEDLYHHRIYQKVDRIVRDYAGEKIELLILPHAQHVIKALMSGGGIALLPDDIENSAILGRHDVIKIDILPDDIFIKRAVIYAERKELDLRINNVLDVFL